jgi:magnesium-transporting ATPase (P-type)
MEDTIRVFVKGASEVILPSCECTFDQNGDKVPLDEDKKASMMEQMKEEMSRKGLRTLGFSYKDMSEDEFAEMKESTKNFFN